MYDYIFQQDGAPDNTNHKNGENRTYHLVLKVPASQFAGPNPIGMVDCSMQHVFDT